MRFGKTEKTASLLLGAAAGGLAMYLLDPKQGQARRERIASAAEGSLQTAREAAQTVASSAAAYGSSLASRAADLAERAAELGRQAHTHVSQHLDAAQDALHGGVDSAREAVNAGINAAKAQTDSPRQRVARVKTLVDQAYAAASEAADTASEQGLTSYGKAIGALSHLWSKYDPAHLASHLHGAAQSASDAAQSRASDARARGAEWVQAARVATAKKIAPELSEPASIVLPIAASAIGFGLVGVGLTYYLDPERGSDRRDLAVEQAQATVRRTGHFFRATGREIGDRLRGLRTRGVHAYQSVASSQGYQSGDELVTAVRTALESVIPEQAKLLQILADASGRITISGTVPHELRDKVIDAIGTVPGVSAVINRLSNHSESPSGVTGDLAGGSPRVDPSAPAQHAPI